MNVPHIWRCLHIGRLALPFMGTKQGVRAINKFTGNYLLPYMNDDQEATADFLELRILNPSFQSKFI